MIAPPVLNSKTITYEQLAKTIDHSLLRPELTEADVIAGCELAGQYHVASVCVKPCHVKLAVRLLAGSDIAAGTVVGFLHGNSTGFAPTGATATVAILDEFKRRQV